MKIRNGFVSNSSASSFVIFGHPTTIEEIDDPHVHLFLNTDVGEGATYFRPDKKTIKYIKKNPQIDFGEYFYEYYSVDEVSEISNEDWMKLGQIKPGGITVKVFEIGHWSPDLEEMKDLFSQEEE